MVAATQDVSRETGEALQIRIGIHSGAVVAGVIGQRKFAYDLWGDTVNVAARMESHDLPGRVQVSSDTAALLGEMFKVEPRGEIQIKGKGTMQAFFLNSVDAGEEIGCIGGWRYLCVAHWAWPSSASMSAHPYGNALV